jgi:DNA-binding transcriptional regulator YiaG
MSPEFLASRKIEDRVALSVAEREALKAARIKAGYRLKPLAKFLGVGLSTLASWEIGDRRPSSAQLTAWWRAVSGGDER